MNLYCSCYNLIRARIGCNRITHIGCYGLVCPYYNSIRAHIGCYEITHIGCYELLCTYKNLIIAHITYAMNLFCSWVWIWNCLDLNMKLPLTWTLIWNCHLLELEYEIITHLILNLTYWNHNLLELQFEIAFTWTKYPPLGRISSPWQMRGNDFNNMNSCDKI